jgi:superfamily II DNA or RNA helicase
MTLESPSLFDRLKRSQPVSCSAGPTPELFFRLCFERGQAWLVITDSVGTEIDPDPDQYHGTTRKLLRKIDGRRRRQRFHIEWNDHTNAIDLSDNEHLLWYLRDLDHFTDREGVPIRFDDTPSTLGITIDGDRQLECRLVLWVDTDQVRDFQLISDSQVFVGGTIHPVAPPVDDFRLLPAFETMILANELENYLTLLFSFCNRIRLEYCGYRVVSAAKRTARPTLVMEKVNRDHSLILRLSQTLAGFDPDFVERYDLTRVVSVNPSERTVVVSDLVYQDMGEHVREISALLDHRIRAMMPTETGYHLENHQYIIDAELAEGFIRQDLPSLSGRYAIYGSEKLRSYRVVMTQPALKLSLSRGLDLLEGDAFLNIENDVFPLFEALHRHRRHAYIELSDGTRALLDDEYLKRLERLFRRRKNGVQVSLFDLPLVETLIGERIDSDDFHQARSFFEGFHRIRESSPPLPPLNAMLRDYQLDGYKWLKYLHTHRLGGCLADDMGLGKTLQAIALLASLYPPETRPSLIVIPKSLIFNWQNEIRRFCPALDCTVYYGSDRDLQNALRSHLVITTYGVVRNDIERLRTVQFCYVVLDESQQIKNADAQISKAVMLLQSENRLALSGTPIENHLGELFALFRFLNPSLFGSAVRFRTHYAAPLQHNVNQTVLSELKQKIAPFILRRLKQDVLTELPEKIEQILFVGMTPEQRRFYEQRRAYYHRSIQDHIAVDGWESSRFYILQAITDLRQIASIPESRSAGTIHSPKREILIETIRDAIANNRKMLLFANFLAILDVVAEDLQRDHIDFEIMTGATRNRETVIHRFKHDPDCRLFLMTLKTGGLGLNLTEADTVFIYDPWWNIAAENQAIDRTHRIGQDRTVFSYKLITQGTIEERILELQRQKKELFESVITSDGFIPHYFGEADIDYLLGEPSVDSG